MEGRKESLGRKADNGKLPIDLVPAEPIFAVAKVLAFGARKYDEHNWRKGIQWSRLFAAAMRHLWKWWLGEECDEESQLPHLAHALCCIMFLYWYTIYRPEFDDRYLIPREEIKSMDELTCVDCEINGEPCNDCNKSMLDDIYGPGVAEQILSLRRDMYPNLDGLSSEEALDQLDKAKKLIRKYPDFADVHYPQDGHEPEGEDPT